MSKTKADQRREELREQLWPGQIDLIWKGPAEVGYCCAPRVLPLLLHLTGSKNIVGPKSCSTVYVELMSRSYNQGIIEIQDEDEHAYCAGYTSSRARRTWQERVRILEEIGFIRVAPKGNRVFGYVLLMHPFKVVLSLREQGKITDEWWTLFNQHLRSAGIERVLVDPVSPGLRVLQGGAEGSSVDVSSKQRTG